MGLDSGGFSWLDYLEQPGRFFGACPICRKSIGEGLIEHLNILR